MTAGFLGEVREAALRLPAAVRLPQTFTSRYLPGEPEPERETWIAAYDREADEFRLFLTRDARRGRFTDESVLAYRDFAAAVNRRKISGKMISAWLFPHGLDGFRAAHPGCGIGIIDELGKTRHRQEPEVTSALYAMAYEMTDCDWSSDVCSSDLLVSSRKNRRSIILSRFLYPRTS